MISLPPYLIYLLSFSVALTICVVSMPRIIYLTKRKKLFDVPDNKRKLHVTITPNLGGVGIFFAYVIVSCFFLDHILLDRWNYIIASSILLFLTGIYDDLVSISPSKKFLAQAIAAIITICFASDVRLSSLHGLLGVNELPYWISIAFTTVGCIFVTNAYNLVDGIDGLAGSLGALSTLLLGICLAVLGNVGAAVIAFSLCGAIIGFLKYNISPARIFMGDTGSLLVGFTVSILCILFIHSYHYDNPLVYVIHSHKGAMIVTVAILFVPIFDSFRVFTNRILKGGSPFKADRTHLHHFLLDAGFTHSQSVSILLTANILLITVSLIVQDLDANIAIIAIVLLAMGLFGILYYLRKKRLAKNQELIARRSAAMHASAMNAPATAGATYNSTTILMNTTQVEAHQK